jgi:hypothetical protein
MDWATFWAIFSQTHLVTLDRTHRYNFKVIYERRGAIFKSVFSCSLDRNLLPFKKMKFQGDIPTITTAVTNSTPAWRCIRLECSWELEIWSLIRLHGVVCSFYSGGIVTRDRRISIRGQLFVKLSWGVRSTYVRAKFGRSVIETFSFILNKRASLGRSGCSRTKRYVCFNSFFKNRPQEPNLRLLKLQRHPQRWSRLHRAFIN